MTGDERFAAFDIELKRRGRGRWKWSVCGTGGHAIMCGSECSQAAARYKAQRALFLLLCASASRLAELPPEPSDPSPRAAPAISRARARRLENRTAIEGLRQQRKSPSENVAKHRSAHAAVAALAAMARLSARRSRRRSGDRGLSEP
ncbi:hypothetical protein [Bradyrhizobium sp. NAS96.2]|uniref:hypothetical protein n=1 Tax=Bradyrhizobium sp. NAS96.2 TaxID=1680160 RepID=UPI0009391D69|nr:hypothetical protein [Bradyrhizobium sp. NAS96.2]OKO69939.1 hypothetical protein AC628_32185 [Bradyrhizobium sp. NAS96.2]